MGLVMLGCCAEPGRYQGSIIQQINHGFHGAPSSSSAWYERATRAIAEHGGLSKVMPVRGDFSIMTMSSIAAGAQRFIGER